MTASILDVRIAREGVQEALKIALPTKVSFRFVRIARKLDEILKDADASMAIILDRFSLKDEEGNAVKAKDKDGNPIHNQVALADGAGYSEAVNELLDSKVELEFQPFSEEELVEALEDIKLPGEILMKMFGVAVN